METCTVCAGPAAPGHPHLRHCRAWALSPTRQRLVLVCRLDLAERDEQLNAHPGPHRDGEWSWVSGQEPTGREWQLPRRADPADLAALCAELRVLAEGLAEALPRPVRPDRSSVRAVRAAAAPVDMDVLIAGQQLATAVASLATELRQELGHRTAYTTFEQALEDMPELARALPAGAELAVRVPAVLVPLAARVRRLLDPDLDWLPLGRCPSRFDEPVDVVTAEGLVEGDHGCWTLDRAETAAAAARGEHTEVWRRSRIGICRGGDVERADITCRACGYRCSPADRACDLVVANGVAFTDTLLRLARVLAVPLGTLKWWRGKGLIRPVEEGVRPLLYDGLAVAQVAVARRARGAGEGCG